MSENPYEAPKAVTTILPTGRISVGAWIMAVISGVFVMFATVIVLAFSHLFVGDWLPHTPIVLRPILPIIPVAVGIFAAWRSIVYSKRQAVAKQKAHSME